MFTTYNLAAKSLHSAHERLDKNRTLLQCGFKKETDGIISNPIRIMKYDMKIIRILIAQYFIKRNDIHTLSAHSLL